MIKYLVLLLLFAGCTTNVPAGHIGRVQTPAGFNAEILRPGRHSCWGRDNMYLMETTDINVEIKMDVLCNDSLNFKFTIDLLVSLDLTDPTQAMRAFEDLKPAVDRTITVEQLFATYVRASAAQEAQKVISKYRTSEIVEKRAEIIEEVATAVKLSSQHSLVQVKRVALSNLDFPDIITRAQEMKAQRNVEIETAQAEGQIAMAKGRAQLQLAELSAQRKLLEAAAVADANKIIASSITPNYLAYEQIQAMSNAAAGDNNVFFFPYEDGMNKQIDSSRWSDPNFLLDAEVRKKLNEAQAESKKRDAPQVLAPEPPAPLPTAPDVH